MNNIQSNLTKHFAIGLLMANLVASCGVKSIDDSIVTNPVNQGRNGTVYVPGTDRASNWTRLCSKPVIFTSPGAIEGGLEKYFFSSIYGIPAFPGEVKDLELPVNWCFKIASGGTRAAFRIEYEDHYGGGWYEMSATKNTNTSNLNNGPVLFHAEIDTTRNLIDVIFLDSQGFTQISGPKIGDFYEAQIRFANLPKETDYVDNYVENIVNKCRTGEWTVAQCLGYNFPPQFWWNEYERPTTHTVEYAREMLDGGGSAETGTIGTMKFRLSDVLWQ